jgi:peptide methionine sulfoxide reductase msrA/msrB
MTIEDQFFLAEFYMNKKHDDESKDLKNTLTPLQYEVTQNDGTEAPFANEYWDNKAEGIYVDIVSGEVLFSSKHKYDSGTGWPSFYQPLVPDNLQEISDHKLARMRTEIRSKIGNSHLGHVFDDGPKPTGKRYCMNSAALRFIPKDQLVAQGYEKYLAQFGEESNQAIAYFAGGCFWCVEEDFLKTIGVNDVISGYMGGLAKNPSYENVCDGTTGHAETVAVHFDPKKIGYEDLVKVFLLHIDPTVKNRQFCDVGNQYRTAIFYLDEQQKQAANKAVDWLKKTFTDINPVTEISHAKEFYRAEEYHQRYAEKNPDRYQAYRRACGREERLIELYGTKREQFLQNFQAKK